MPVNEQFEDPGSFEVALDPEKGPLDEILNQIRPHGHLVVTPQWVDHPDMYTEAEFLGAARYSGPVLKTEWASGALLLKGAGNVWHLGDGETGPIHARLLEFSAATPSTVLDVLANDGILPAAITQGTITETGVDAYTGNFFGSEYSIQSLRTYMAATNMHFRINPDWSLDACLSTRDDVFTVTSPTVIAVRDGFGSDPNFDGIEPVSLRSIRDGSRWVSRSVIEAIAYDGGGSVAGFLDRTTNPYFDPQGNALIRNVVQSGPSSDALDWDTFHNRTLSDWDTFNAQEIDTDQYEFSGPFKVGDHIYVFDPPSGFIDTDTEPIWYRGQWMQPAVVPVSEDEWELVEGMGVYYRPGGASITTADYFDLTRYFVREAA